VQVILKIFADTGQRVHNVDADGFQQIGRSDAGNLQQVRRSYRAGAQNGLRAGPGRSALPAQQIIHPGRAPVCHCDPCHGRARRNCKVRST